MTSDSYDGLYPPHSASAFQPRAPGWWMRMTSTMRQQPVWISSIIPLLLTLAMGWLDDVTGWEVSLFILYAAPIVLAVWWDGPTAGFFISVISGTVWWIANIDTHPYATTWGYAWAMVNRMFYFSVVVFAVAVVRKKQDADADHILMLEERRQLEKDIVTVSEHEQQRIGQDLHDGLCQHLAAVGCAARVLAEELQSRDMPEAHDAVMIEEALQQAVLEARDLARGIFPVHVDRDGLSAALSDLAQLTSRLTGAEIVVRDDAEVMVDNPEAAMHLYRIAQEAVGNAVRHGKARQVVIRLAARKPDGVVLTVEDNGSGMKERHSSKAAGMGLRTMRYRAQALDGTLEIKTAAKTGTVVQCQVPAHTLSPTKTT